MGRRTIILVMAAGILLVCICVSWRLGYSGESRETSGPEQRISNSAAPKEIFKAVLLGDSSFFYCSEGKVETMDITGVPAIFDKDDPMMKIWEFSIVDLDGDGEDEVILFVVGVAGDMGGKVIFHQIDNEVYGYSADNRSLADLKTDGTYSYSDATGVAEAGIASVIGFSRDGYTVDKITSAAGTYEGWNSFTAGNQPATEEEYADMVSMQEKKQDVEWYDFSDENIGVMF